MKTILLFLALTNHLLSLANNTIRGKIENKENYAIQWANITLYEDSTFVVGAISDQNGYFSFERIKNANRIMVSALGYKEYTGKIPDDGNLGVITLIEDTMTLQEIVVKGNLPTTRVLGNAMVTNVENSIMSKLGTAKDVLKKIPLVIENDGSYIVFGRGTPEIYINGRLLRDKTDLEQINSEHIKSVEVISNPGSQYSSKTNAVIRIKTLRPKGDGISVSFDNSSKFAHYILNSNNLLLKYRNRGIEVFVDGHFNGGKRKFHEISSITTYNKEIFKQQLDVHTTKTYSEFYTKLGFNYQFNDKHSFGMYYKAGRSKTGEKGTSNTDIMVDNVLIEKLLQHKKGINLTLPNQEGNIYYSGTIGKLSINFNGDFVQKEVSKNDTQYELNDNTQNHKVLTDATNRSKLKAEKLVFSYPIWKGVLHIGEEFTDSYASYLSEYEGNNISGGNIEIKEKNLATFLEVSQTLGKLRMGMGVRFEYVRYRYFNKGILENELSQNYKDWFPNFSIATQIGEVGFSLNITSRTQRPSYRQLDGTLNYVNRYSYQTGNPSLKPAQKYTTQLLAQWRMFFVQTIYSYEKDAIFYKTAQYNDDPLIKVVYSENVPKLQQLQIALGAKFKFRNWTTQPTLGLFNNFFCTDFLDANKKFNKPFLFFNCNNNIELSHNWNIDADLMLKTAGNVQNCYIKTSGYFNVGIRKSFFNKNLVFQLKFNDLFNTSNEKIILYNGDIKVCTDNYQESRNAVITLRYKFNTTNSKYKGGGAGTNEKKRL